MKHDRNMWRSKLKLNEWKKVLKLKKSQEGIVFSLFYGIEIMVKMGLNINTVRAGKANMFQSDIFTEAFANTTGATIELVNTDGAQGAARGAGLGAGIYKDTKDAFKGLKELGKIEPSEGLSSQYKDAYGNWLNGLQF